MGLAKRCRRAAKDGPKNAHFLDFRRFLWPWSLLLPFCSVLGVLPGFCRLLQASAGFYTLQISAPLTRLLSFPTQAISLQSLTAFSLFLQASKDLSLAGLDNPKKKFFCWPIFREIRSLWRVGSWWEKTRAAEYTFCKYPWIENNFWKRLSDIFENYLSQLIEVCFGKIFFPLIHAEGMLPEIDLSMKEKHLNRNMF